MITSWEVKTDRLGISKEKVEKLIEIQRIRGDCLKHLLHADFHSLKLGLSLNGILNILKLQQE